MLHTLHIELHRPAEKTIAKLEKRNMIRVRGTLHDYRAKLFQSPDDLGHTGPWGFHFFNPRV